MANKVYQFGVLLLLFGGFISLNSSVFGGMSNEIGELGLITLLFGMLVGVFGLTLPAPDARQDD